MIKQIVDLYQEEIRYLDLYYSTECVTTYLEDLVWIEGEINILSLSHNLNDKQTLVSMAKIKEITLRRIHKCLFNDVAIERELLMNYVNELQAFGYDAVV
ncbi:hypothetical protein [Paenibacillus sp. Y412MC10]|uniref:hypothetical protein n=1 Tax=Geobacillus sp. (strain Y412MC10) TaxID=481743 RepID=UPI0011AB8E0F|nr:hypothetical protein [Paenibacillus sp. Y412MC10]